MCVQANVDAWVQSVRLRSVERDVRLIIPRFFHSRLEAHVQEGFQVDTGVKYKGMFLSLSLSSPLSLFLLLSLSLFVTLMNVLCV